MSSRVSPWHGAGPALALACVAPIVFAQSPDVAPPVAAAAPGENAMQLLYDRQRLSGGFGDWSGLTLRGTWRARPDDLLAAELSSLRRFGAGGTYASVGDTHTFNPDWYGSLSVGAGDGAFYLPRYRVDATLNRKLLASRQLVGTFGAGYYRAPDGHTDRSLLLGATYYFNAPWIVEGGVRFNHSDPGAVQTSQQYVAVTAGRPQADLFTLRHAWGGEGYLATAANSQLVNFRSRETSVGWQHRLGPHHGVSLGAVHYSNPLYRRTGLAVGVFADF
jgi:YaiO family outer membrane protein